MKLTLVLVAALFATPLAAEDAAEAVPSSTAQAFVDLANSSCLPIAAGKVAISATSAEDDLKTVESFGFSYGINSEVYDRFGVQGSGILNRSVMGHRSVGEDVVVLAVGGAIPGCKVILLSSNGEGLSDEVSDALSASSQSWRELPFDKTRAGSRVTKRSFILRDQGKPFLLNLIDPPVPDSDIQLLITINSIPPNIKLPEGY